MKDRPGTSATGGTLTTPRTSPDATTTGPAGRSTGAALAEILVVLDSIDHAQREGLTRRERLDLIGRARLVSQRAEALLGVVVGEADQAQAAKRVTSTPTTSWLALPGNTSSSEAAGLVFAGRDVTARPATRDAALAGVVSVPQARSISRVMAGLPETLTAAQRAAAEQMLLEKASTTTAKRLEKLGEEVLAQVAPEAIPDPADKAAELAAEQRVAHTNRRLWFGAPRDGSIQFEGSLPVLVAKQFRDLIDAQVAADRRAMRDAADASHRLGAPTMFEQSRADALATWIMGSSGQLPDMPQPLAAPRVVVTMTEQGLREQAERAGVIDPDTRISPGELRRLCCDAGLIPVVLGSHSEILDVGRESRCVTPAIRLALQLRDGGCVFPGCDKPPTACVAHHLVPWWRGGITSLENLALLCPHHHTLIEPPRQHHESPQPSLLRWQIRMGPRGRPVAIPPFGIDPRQEPIEHARTASQIRSV